MSEVPRITGAQAVRAFELAGFAVDRIRGSHFIMKKNGCRELLSIPNHAGETVGLGLLRKQIRVAGLTVEQFREFLG
jgi:predicted RNA binding protein YcfA (HicA-like mRNA interferase family)